MRVDCRLTSEVLDCLTPLVQPDVTTLEIDASRPRLVARITRRIRIQLEPKQYPSRAKVDRSLEHRAFQESFNCTLSA